MRDFIKRFILFSLLSVPALSCVNEDLVEPTVGDGEAIVDLRFGFKDFDEVKVETRATMDIVPESRVSNLYAVLFVGGKRYYSHYFHKGSLAPTKNDMDKISADCWYVQHKLSHSDGSVDADPTEGWLRFVAPECTGGHLYLIANLDADMVNVSNEKLNMIDTEQDLKDYVISLNQEITSRNGLFPMVGYKEGVNVSATGGITGTDNKEVDVELERLDAKVVVNVRCATDYELKSDDGSTTQRLKEFRPESWSVVNLPKGEYLLKRDVDADGVGYFSTDPVKFETSETKTFTYWNGEENVEVSSDVSGFSFYMLENREKAKREVSKFHDREKKNKDSHGFFNTTYGVWTNAPENGTYMVIKGEVVMDVDVSSEAKQQQLSADVVYYIHLGDIRSDLNNYKIERNTFYTYNITIKGVNSIEVEVSSSHDENGSFVSDPNKVIENEPGAEGMVYIAKESMYTFDAHYGQRVFCFDAEFIDTDALTWYVKTPFGHEGTPEKIGDVEIPSGMDYEWVHFMVNKVSDSDLYKYKVNGESYTANLGANPFSWNNQPYPGDGDPRLMNVVGLVKYIKTQKRNKDAGKENDFRTEFDQGWFDWYNKNADHEKVDDPKSEVGGQPWFRDRIYVTAFVDEFYYEKDPITGEASETLWKRFVNQPNRMMHILCDNVKSLDGASSSTGSVVTIRQRSIQTPYNINNPNVKSAWGCETEDENADSYFWYFSGEKDASFPNDFAKDYGNASVQNGLYNTARMLGCVSGSAWNDLKWDKFLDYERPNDFSENGSEYNILFLRKDYASLQYSAITRNRDNNGNGIIDPDEIRWYDAAIGQLEYLLLGELGLSDEAALYTRKYSRADGTYDSGHPFSGVSKWQCHIVSSTKTYVSMKDDNKFGYVPQVLWAEEGVSVSGYKQYSGETGPYVVKCIRNLGLRDAEASDFQDEAKLVPDPLVTVSKPEGPVDMHSVYKFDASRVNTKSMRFYTTVELEPSDEFNEMSRLYSGFETGELVMAQDYGIYNYYRLYQIIRGAESPCPDGYRVPNIRECVLMYLMADDEKWWIHEGNPTDTDPRIYCGTYYSLGYLGSNKNIEPGAGDGVYRYSWNILSSRFGGGNINLSSYNKNKYIRCVRDWDPSAD